jgi:predicted AlkP superfamily phosphohydrolase/phosphomutase
VLEDGASQSDVVFDRVDWSRSRAYALGLNGLFVNVAGRESQGIVDPADLPALKDDIAAKLTGWTDAERDQPVVRRVFDGLKIYPGSRDNDETPDLVIGYHRGYRASWQTTLGAVPPRLMEPNRQKWSGDHCIDPELVPGVLFTSFEPDREVDSLLDIWPLARGQLR